MVNGTVYDSFTLEWGKDIPLPAKDPTMEAEEGYVYNFVKWVWGEEDVPAFATMSERELVFEAVFKKAEENAVFDTMNNNNLLFEVILPCFFAGFLVLVAGLVTFIVLRKRARKKKMAAALSTAAEPTEETAQVSAEPTPDDETSAEETEPQAESDSLEDVKKELLEEQKGELLDESDDSEK